MYPNQPRYVFISGPRIIQRPWRLHGDVAGHLTYHHLRLLRNCPSVLEKVAAKQSKDPREKEQGFFQRMCDENCADEQDQAILANNATLCQ